MMVQWSGSKDVPFIVKWCKQCYLRCVVSLNQPCECNTVLYSQDHVE